MNTSTIVQKLWNYCNVLRDAGPEFRCGPALVVGRRGFRHRYRMTRQHPLRGRIPTSWGPCSARRVASIFYGDYVEAAPAKYYDRTSEAGLPYRARGIRTSLISTATYLLFLKMADERTKAPYNQKSPVPEKYGWPSALTPALSTPVPDFVLPPPSLESSRREGEMGKDG